MAKQKRKSKKQLQIQQQRRQEIIRYVVALIVIALVIISLLRLGQAGDMIDQALKNVFGNIPYYLVMIQIIAYCGYVLYNGQVLALTSRYIVGAIFFNIGSMILFGCIDAPTTGFASLNKQTIEIAPIGYLQMAFYGLFSSFAGKYGAGVIAIVFMIIGIIIYYMISVSQILKNRAAKLNEHTMRIKENLNERKENAPQRKSIKEPNDKPRFNFPTSFPSFNKKDKQVLNTNGPSLVTNAKSTKIKDFFANQEDDELASTDAIELGNEDINQHLNYGSISDEKTTSNDQENKQTSIFDHKVDDLALQTQELNQIPFEIDDLNLAKTQKPVVSANEQILDYDQAYEDVKAKEIKIKKKLKNSEKTYKLPSFDLLNNPKTSDAIAINKKYAQEQSVKLTNFLKTYKINAHVDNIIIGPSVTKFEIALDSGIRVNRISGMYDDIKMALAVKELRIEAPIPGKSLVGIEIPNIKNNIVTLKEVLNDIDYTKENKLVFGIGKDINGKSIYTSMDKMPHLLIAGSTGSGKSVMINSIIISLLMNASYNEVKLLLVDPKQVELSIYNDIPHLLTPVVNDPKAASIALKKIVDEMEIRYQLMAKTNTRKIEDYNKYVTKFNASCGDESLMMNKMPYIVVVIDELADLMLVSKAEVEESIMRITQLARAAGIYLIVATQRPSTDVITGVIKNNLPSRIAFAVSSQVDSRTILGSGGAESLLGKGDMLYAPVGLLGGPTRVQGSYLSDEEISNVVFAIKRQGIPIEENEIFSNLDVDDAGNFMAESSDEMYDEIEDFVKRQENISTSRLQREFRIGYNRAANLIDDLERNGIISAQRGSKPRDVLIRNEELE